MHNINALITEYLYDLERVEVKAKSLPNHYDRPGNLSFPREDSYLLVSKNDDAIMFWVPGYCNDCYVSRIIDPQDSTKIKEITTPICPHFSDDDGPSREMERILYKKDLQISYAKYLVEICGKKAGLFAFMTASCSQRAEAALKALSVKDKGKE